MDRRTFLTSTAIGASASYLAVPARAERPKERKPEVRRCRIRLRGTTPLLIPVYSLHDPHDRPVDVREKLRFYLYLASDGTLGISQVSLCWSLGTAFDLLGKEGREGFDPRHYNFATPDPRHYNFAILQTCCDFDKRTYSVGVKPEQICHFFGGSAEANPHCLKVASWCIDVEMDVKQHFMKNKDAPFFWTRSLPAIVDYAGRHSAVGRDEPGYGRFALENFQWI